MRVIIIEVQGPWKTTKYYIDARRDYIILTFPQEYVAPTGTQLQKQ